MTFDLHSTGKKSFHLNIFKMSEYFHLTNFNPDLHLLLFITAKYAFICANRQSIKRIYIHLHEAAIIYAKRTLICKFCIIFGIQLHYWSFNCAFGHSMKKINFHLRGYLYHWREKKIQVRQSKVNSVNITFIYIFSTLIDKQ